MSSYIDIIGEFYPTAECYSAGDPNVYSSIVWTTTPISQATLDTLMFSKEQTDKIMLFGSYAKLDIENGFYSSALGTPYYYDSTIEDQLNIVGATASGIDMYFSNRKPVAGYQEVNVGGAVVGTDATGLANDTTSYTVELQIDGVSTFVSVAGQDAQTYTLLLAQIQTQLDLTSAGTITLNAGNIKIESATFGITSTVNIVSPVLFSSLTQYVGILVAVPGVDPNLIAKNYMLHTAAQLKQVLDDGAATKLTILQKFNTKKVQILAAVDSAALAAIVW